MIMIWDVTPQQKKWVQVSPKHWYIPSKIQWHTLDNTDLNICCHVNIKSHPKAFCCSMLSNIKLSY